jgi:hypothetical protein
MSPHPKPILLPTPTGPQPGITPQPPTAASSSISSNPATASSSTSAPAPSSSIDDDESSSKPKARLAEPEIVHVPAHPVPYASISDDESEGEPDEEAGEVLGEDGLPKARGMLKNLGDDTDVRLPCSRLAPLSHTVSLHLLILIFADVLVVSSRTLSSPTFS